MVCFNYDGMTQKRVECINTHPEQTETKGFAFECFKCEYIVVLTEEETKVGALK